jgi:hypothetical protein
VSTPKRIQQRPDEMGLTACVQLVTPIASSAAEAAL